MRQTEGLESRSLGWLIKDNYWTFSFFPVPWPTAYIYYELLYRYSANSKPNTKSELSFTFQKLNSLLKESALEMDLEIITDWLCKSQKMGPKTLALHSLRELKPRDVISQNNLFHRIFLGNFLPFPVWVVPWHKTNAQAHPVEKNNEKETGCIFSPNMT